MPHPSGLSDQIIRDKSFFKQKDSYHRYIDMHQHLHVRLEKEYFLIPSQIKKKSTKIYVDRELIFNSKKSNKVIKFSWKDAILAHLYVSFDYHACACEEDSNICLAI